MLLYYGSGLSRLLRNLHSSTPWHAECVSTTKSNAATDIGLEIEDGIDMCCYWVHLPQRCGEYNDVSKTPHSKNNTRLKSWRHIAFRNEHGEELWEAGWNYLYNLQPSSVKKIHKTTRRRFLDLLGRALVSVYFLHAKQRFYVVTCLDSTAIKTTTPKKYRTN